MRRLTLFLLALITTTFTLVSASRSNSLLLLNSDTHPSETPGKPVLPPYPTSPWSPSLPPSPAPESSSDAESPPSPPPPRSSPPPPVRSSPPPPSLSPPPPPSLSPPPPRSSPPPPSPPPPPVRSSPPPPSPSPPPPPPPPPPPSPSPPPPPPRHLPAATLSNLKLSDAKLSPEFDPKVFNYSASVGSGVNSVRITAEVPEEEESDEYTITVNFIPLKSGVASPQLRIGKAGQDVEFEITVTALEHETSTYYLLVHRGKSKWDSFGAKFLLALAIILVILVLAFIAYGCYVCISSGRMPSVWPFNRGEGDGYTSLPDAAGPSGN